MLHMAAVGDIGPMPHVAFFADTQAEPQAVYAHLHQLRGLNSLPFPIRVLTRGSLRESVRLSMNSTGQRFASVPFFVKGAHSKKEGQGRRQCTREFKLDPLWAAIRAELGVKPRGRVPKGIVVETWVGITTDEIQRASASRHLWEHKRHPLIELNMSRGDCIEWLKRHELPIPVKSRCVFCPYTSNAEWRRIKADDPDQWADACKVDAFIRRGRMGGMRGEQFIHRSCEPLATADLRAPDPRQGSMGDLCEGMCGV